jgi:hypothetical protein
VIAACGTCVGWEAMKLSLSSSTGEAEFILKRGIPYLSLSLSFPLKWNVMKYIK